jgi:AraC-like DNA-binding protein
MQNEYSNPSEKSLGIILDKQIFFTEPEENFASANALNIHFGDKSYKVLFSNGFYISRNDCSTYHTHSSYREVIITLGDCEFVIDNKIYPLSGTNILVMPPKVFHKMLTVENVEVCTFFIDMEFDLTVRSLPEELTRIFFNEARRVHETKDFSLIAPYLSLIISILHSSDTSLEPERVNDYAYLIDYFFNYYYMDDVSLETLANHLHVSVTHAHRLVRKYTGNTFIEELTYRRLKVSDFLINHRGMTHTEAAKAVGFGSYTAFWKARTKYKDSF